VAADATDEIKLHAGHVAITVDNVTGWVTTIRDKALEVQNSTDAAATQRLVQEILALANQTVNGVDLKGDGQILPIPGSGGALTSYQHAQLMAVVPILPGNNLADQGDAAQPATPPADTAPTATTASAPPPAGNEVKIDIVQFEFGAGPATVKVGTKVTWTNLDTAPHTATADNNSFDSGTLQKGQSFSFTVQQTGSFDYYCALHGGPGKQGMSSTLTVEP
jgi:plastocyanin